MDMSNDWLNAVFMSEVGFIFHLPYFVKINRPTAFQTLFTKVLLVAKCVCVLGMLITYHSPFSLKLFFGLACLVHFITYVFLENSRVKYNKKLHVVSLISFINFLLNTGLKTKASSNAVQILQCLGGILYLLVVFAVTDLDKAWWCYTSNNLYDYDFGTCPTFDSRPYIMQSYTICKHYEFVQCKERYTHIANTLHFMLLWANRFMCAVFAIYFVQIPAKTSAINRIQFRL